MIMVHVEFLVKVALADAAPPVLAGEHLLYGLQGQAIEGRPAADSFSGRATPCRLKDLVLPVFRSDADLGRPAELAYTRALSSVDLCKPMLAVSWRRTKLGAPVAARRAAIKLLPGRGHGELGFTAVQLADADYTPGLIATPWPFRRAWKPDLYASLAQRTDNWMVSSQPARCGETRGTFTAFVTRAHFVKR
jgi:hypothetical protein